MDEDYLELKAWLDETRDVPLEAMDAFFDPRNSRHRRIETERRWRHLRMEQPCRKFGVP